MLLKRIRRNISLGNQHFGLVIVPQQTAVVVERFGKYRKLLDPGLHFLIPIIESRAYIHSLKEEVSQINQQVAITKDNVSLLIDGVIYTKVIDPYKASYGVSDPKLAITQLAQTTMRSELGKMTLDSIFQERERLNTAIVTFLNHASEE